MSLIIPLGMQNILLPETTLYFYMLLHVYLGDLFMIKLSEWIWEFDKTPKIWGLHTEHILCSFAPIYPCFSTVFTKYLANKKLNIKYVLNECPFS